MMARLTLAAVVLLAALPACTSSDPVDPPVQGLAAAQAGLDAEGNPVNADADLIGSAGRDRVSATASPTPRGGLLALFAGGKPSGLVTADSGSILPFGQVAPACGVSARALGKAVDQAPRDGRTQWKLHDPSPGATGPRTQYLTGFNDRCARRFTGALVLFGAPDVHEATRYAEANRTGYSATDTAYEQVKSKICGVRPTSRCPADRAARMARSVSFVTVYPEFGATGHRLELLLVNGELVAQAVSGG